ncbi:DUF3352 domain-containing protein [Planktothricoides raciborskii]|nr:DUF3352 domain-containing protein [Planktothricoides raciborskii]
MLSKDHIKLMKPQKKFNFFTIFAAIVLVLELASCGVSGGSPSDLHTLFGHTLFGDEGKVSPEASIFVPKQAPFMASLLVNPDQLEEFVQQTAASKNTPQISRQLQQVKESLLAPTQVNYSTDIQPWLGNEITLAMTTSDIDRDPINGSQPGYLVAIATKDPQASREFLTHFWENKPLVGHELVLEDYAGVQLIYSNGFNASELIPLAGGIKPLSGDWASAVVGDRFVLFGNHPKVLREAINNVQAGGLNLEGYPPYQAAIAPLIKNSQQNNQKNPQIGLTFINMPQFLAWLSDRPSGSNPDLTPENFDQELDLESPEIYEHLAISLELKKQGLVAQVAGNLIELTATNETSETSPLRAPVGALKYIPASVDILASGSNLPDFWAKFAPNLAKEGVISALVNPPLTKLESSWKVNLPEDIFSWVTGEYALGLIGTNTPVQNPNWADWIFVAEKGENTEAGIAHLDAIARQEGYTTGSVTFEDLPLSAWTKLTAAKVEAGGNLSLKAKVQGLHTTVGNYEIFASSINTLQSALNAANNAANSESILQQESFSDAIAALRSPNYGYIYLNWQNAEKLLKREFPILQLLEIAGNPIFDNLGSLTFSAYEPESGYQRGNILLKTKGE